MVKVIRLNRPGFEQPPEVVRTSRGAMKNHRMGYRPAGPNGYRFMAGTPSCFGRPPVSTGSAYEIKTDSLTSGRRAAICVNGYVTCGATHSRTRCRPTTRTGRHRHFGLGEMQKGTNTNVQLSRAMLTLSTGRRLNAGCSGSTDWKPVSPHSATTGTFIRTM